ncbi:MAG: DUF4445 domain-containing protein [Syntrophaceae bacterium]|nr:DUF4445 domain-containing protein [Syntrophaceae bacterium]
MRIQSFEKDLNVPKGTNLLSALASAGIHLRNECGGVGRCGKCRVLCADGLTPPNESEMKIIGAKNIQKGVRLACQSKVLKSTEVHIPQTSMERRIKILVEGSLKELKLNPSVKKKEIRISSQSLKRDLSWEAIRSQMGSKNRLESYPTLHFLKQLSENGNIKEGRLSCILMSQRCLDMEKGAGTGYHLYGMAFDIGTTTIVGYLHDLTSGNQLSLSAIMNPQTKFGGDVVSRILHATSAPNGLRELQDAVIGALNEIIQEVSKKTGILNKQIYEICAVGNTTMHHLLLGLCPSNLTHFPYTPTIREAFSFPAKEIGVSIHPDGQFYLLPLISGFMGSDTVGVVLSTGLHKSKHVNLAIDIGTNGEIVLGNCDRMVAASCAAGPAFEGGQIQYGMPGTSGAIDGMAIDSRGQIRIHTIDGLPPLGICGSGLVDAISEMIRERMINQDGRLLNKEEIGNRNLASRMIRTDSQEAFLLYQEKGNRNQGQNILITQKDVRQLQLAKSAIWAGIQILAGTIGIPLMEINEVFLAGAFGNYVKPESAIHIGLLPYFKKTKITPVGNAAGSGAKMALLSLKKREEANRIAQKIEYIELAKHSDFQNEYIKGMAFPLLKRDGSHSL